MDFFDKAKIIAKIILRTLWLLVSISLWLFGLYVFIQNIQSGQALLGWFLWALLSTPTTFFITLKFVPTTSVNYITGAIWGLLGGIVIGPWYILFCFTLIVGYIADDFNSLKE